MTPNNEMLLTAILMVSLLAWLMGTRKPKK